MVRSAAVGARTKNGGASTLGMTGGRQSDISTAVDMDISSYPNNQLGQSSNPAYDILFLKRLLYLKASIDQDVTADSYKTPMTQDA